MVNESLSNANIWHDMTSWCKYHSQGPYSDQIARYGTWVPHWKYEIVVRFIRPWTLQLQWLGIVVWFCQNKYPWENYTIIYTPQLKPHSSNVVFKSFLYLENKFYQTQPFTMLCSSLSSHENSQIKTSLTLSHKKSTLHSSQSIDNATSYPSKKKQNNH